MSRSGLLTRAIADTPIAVVDFETTGLTPGIDRVIEVSVVRIDPGSEPRLVFDTLVDPARRVAATEIHGFTDDDVADAPLFEDIAGALIDSLSECVVAAYNVYFDMRFFTFEFERLGVARTPPHLCLMYLRPMLRLGDRCSLEKACQHHGVEYKVAHETAADCQASAQLMRVYSKQIERMGLQTFQDLAALRNYKFVSSFSFSPLRHEPDISSGKGRHPKPRGRSSIRPAAAEAIKDHVPPKLGTRRGIQRYWDALKNAVTDLEMTDTEIAEPDSLLDSGS